MIASPFLIKNTIVLFIIMIINNIQFNTNLVAQNAQPIRIAFYNAENFFDLEHDSTRDYNAFTPDGEQHWNLNRYLRKRNNLFKTLVALGAGKTPALVGFCEMENENVFNELIRNTPLRQESYKVVHYESPDRRGIDVGLIYCSDIFRLLVSEPISVKDPQDPGFLTRDILFAGFELSSGDTLFVYINHWPSRYGGQLESVSKRILAATTLRRHYDSLLLTNPLAKVIMMGDFNDTPVDESLLKGLRAYPVDSISAAGDLIQLFHPKEKLGHEGTLKHGHDWQIFDQMIVSPSLYHHDPIQPRLHYCKGSAAIFAPSFLLTVDERYLGLKLFRTYTGPTYIGGFSDHLPVYIDLCLP